MVEIKRKRRRAGVFLIGVLLLVVVVAMFVGASFEVGVWGLKSGASQSQVMAAQRAARSGVAYVMGRLRNDPTWKAETAATVVNDPDLVVVEDHGIVIGLLRNGDTTSQFRIRFNYYDGTNGGDAMDDPSASMKIDWNRVSLNNMLGSTTVTIPLADGPGGSVPATPTAYGELPSRAIFVAVEGRSGSWLSQATAANPNPAQPPSTKVSVSHIETVYKIAAPPQGSRAVAGSAGDLLAQVATGNKKDNVSLDTTDSTKIPRLRSKGALTISGGKSGEDNLVAGNKGGEYGSILSPTVVTSSATSVTESAADPLLGVSWSALEKAVPSVTPSDNVLAAGVYSVWQDGSLHYYDTDLAGYRALMTANPADAGATAVLPNSITYNFGGGKANFKVTSSTYVNATVNTGDVSIIPKIGVDGGPGVADPNLQQIGTVTDSMRADKIKLEFKPAVKNETASLTSTGKVNLGANISGDGGSITAEGDVNVVSLGVDLSAYGNPKQGVSLYTKKNLLMSTYDDGGSGSYKKVSLKGVVYAWGDMEIKLGDTGVAENKWGKFDLTGAMTAYGKDPDDLVAVASLSHIKMTAAEINLKYDETYVQGALSGIPANFELQRARWLQY